MARFLVVLDVDSTLINEEAIELIADEAGSGADVARITERAMAGELDFADSLAQRVATLADLPVARLARAASRITVTTGARELIDAVHAAGGAAAVVSGGFHELLDPIAAELDLDAHRANRLEAVDARLTGRTTGAVIDAAAKADALREWAAHFGVPLTRTIAVGDGANDLDMMRVAQLSVAFCAKPVVRARAHVAVDGRDLSAVLPLLGLRG
ncbi:phosphoserine phosphatase [Microcella alkaliphila]|uniref:phosphoserine phosphatase n=1 Tax=Microcella alkaliphila TaxID=279828 RepID=A0A4V6MCC7_9MICO|nr:phosphoserine phosphatase SerB [Microcella alkaliphila]RZT64109.1 phosphoserine phosphatase [Microcella alkaliphila]